MSRRFALPAVLLASFVVASACAVIGEPAIPPGHRDNTPPTFAGIKSATTCIPGPIGGGRTSSYHLGWDAATDDVTPQKQIVYDVYQAEKAGGEDFSKPTYTTDPGATTFSTPQLASDKTFHFVVRARDEAGNRDSNKVEIEGQNLCE